MKVQGRWVYLYRAIDGSGVPVDVMVSETRDMAAAKAFFRSAKAVNDITPARVTTDGHGSCPQAIRSELGERVRHRTRRYLKIIGWSRIIEASKADTGPCVGSSASGQRPASVEATTNSATSSAPAHCITSPSPPATAAGTSSALPQPRSAFCRLRSSAAQGGAADAGHGCRREF